MISPNIRAISAVTLLRLRIGTALSRLSSANVPSAKIALLDLKQAKHLSDIPINCVSGGKSKALTCRFEGRVSKRQ